MLDCPICDKNDLSRLDKHLTDLHMMKNSDVSKFNLYGFDKKLSARSLVHIQFLSFYVSFTFDETKSFYLTRNELLS